MEDYRVLWEKTLSKLEIELNALAFELWFQKLEFIEYKSDQTLVVCAQNETAKKQIEKSYIRKFEETVKSFYNSNSKIEILIPSEKEQYLSNLNSSQNGDFSNNENQNCFNPKFTFDNFVVGKSNNFVYAAARAVADKPGTRFNPLFIYGGVGLGKTHLLHAIGNYISEHNPQMRIKYVTCEKFTNDYIESLFSKQDEGKLLEFREKYRNIDILMVDDIQFLEKKKETQEEFFHTFNDLWQNEKQIILTSDRPPKEIENLAERLATRFSSGLTQDIQPPDFETRIAILKKKAQQERYFIDDEVIEFIADKIDNNIREMEGLLSKVHFFATLQGKKIAGIDEARQAFQEKIENSKDDLSIDGIVDAICSYFNVSKIDIIGKKKSKEIVEPRMVAIYLISELLDIPLIAIGKYFGGRDHTTIIHARDKINDSVKSSELMKKMISELKSLIIKD